MTDPGRAVIFGRDADAYEASRPSYPQAAISHIRGLVEAGVVVEIGAGTGKATVDMARPDLRLICLEPSAEMAAVLDSKRLPGVEVVVTTYEDWPGPDATIDLVFAAQAWHWVDPDSAYRRTLGFLRSGGFLALMWNIPQERYAIFEDVYAEHAPELLAERDRRIHKRDSVTWGDDIASAGFADVERFTHKWTDTLTARQARALYSTYSDHMMLGEDVRHRLLAALEAEVERAGGSVEIAYRTEVFSGRKN